MAAVAFSPWMIGVQDRFPLDPKCPFFPYNSLSHPPLRCSSPQQFRQIIRATSAVALEPVNISCPSFPTSLTNTRIIMYICLIYTLLDALGATEI